MNKLLLLATIILSFALRGESAGMPFQGGNRIKEQNFSGDSTIKQMLLADPKQGFKDLFESESINGLNTTRLNPKAISFVQGYVESQSLNNP